MDNLLVENVREFINWGPLDPRTKRPIKRRKGEFFRNFIQTLAGLGYQVEFKVQCAADFGDATSRERFLLMARRSGREIHWPEPSHCDPAQLLPLRQATGERAGVRCRKLKPWRTARECIDFEIPGTSVFNRKKPLCKNTIRRIIAGLRKFGGTNAEPFITILNGTSRAHTDTSAQSLDDPLQTVTGSNRFMLVDGQIKPFVLGQQSGSTARDVDNPLPTVATAGAIRLIEPFITPNFSERKGQKPRNHSTRKPLPTVTGHGAGMLVEPFILPPEGIHRGNAPRSTKRPLQTVTSRGGGQLVEPIIVNTDQTGGNGSYERKINRPLGTVVSKQNMILVEPLLVKYYGTGVSKTVNEPLDTVTTRDRFLLVECGTGRHVAELDIRTRMLQPKELAAAHSFPKHFIFTGSKEDQTKQIGNSVPRRLARAHVRMLLPE